MVALILLVDNPHISNVFIDLSSHSILRDEQQVPETQDTFRIVDYRSDWYRSSEKSLQQFLSTKILMTDVMNLKNRFINPQSCFLSIDVVVIP